MKTELEAKVTQFFTNTAQSSLELRQGQIEMAQEAAQAIALHRSLAVEAEVGIGKTFAYLVPALMQYRNEHRQIVIATSTIALQEQLYKDAKAALRMLNIEVPILLAKGMKHYACMKRIHLARRQHPKDLSIRQLWDAVQAGKQDRAQIGYGLSDAEWEKICIRAFGSQHCEKCEFTSRCTYFRLRSQMKNSHNIIICNHHMLVSHLLHQQEGHGIFHSGLRTLIVDEAHHLEATFRDAVTISYDQGEIIRTIKRCQNGVKWRDVMIANAVDDTVQLFRLFKDQIAVQKEAISDDRSSYYLSVTPAVRQLLGRIKHFLPEIQIEHELTSLYQFLRKAYHNDKNSVIWLSQDDGVRLCICKKEIRRDIRSLLYQAGRTTILTSATITGTSIGTPWEQYEYFLDSIGFPNTGMVAEPKRSPFDYDRNTMLYCPEHLPFPKHEDMESYRECAVSEILRLLEITHGKALILFTAKSDMIYVYKKLSNMGLPYKILMQSSGASQAYPLDKFKNDVNSVILGTGAYWEGISIEGASLSQVIIFKLPFPSPDPIMDYKMSLTEHPIQEVAVPEMLIRLRQGVGRLIRSATDCGIVSILDPRAAKAYPKNIREALPMKRVTGNIQEIAEFWEKLDTKGMDRS